MAQECLGFPSLAGPGSDPANVNGYNSLFTGITMGDEAAQAIRSKLIVPRRPCLEHVDDLNSGGGGVAGVA